MANRQVSPPFLDVMTVPLEMPMQWRPASQETKSRPGGGSPPKGRVQKSPADVDLPMTSDPLRQVAAPTLLAAGTQLSAFMPGTALFVSQRTPPSVLVW